MSPEQSRVASVTWMTLRQFIGLDGRNQNDINLIENALKQNRLWNTTDIRNHGVLNVQDIINVVRSIYNSGTYGKAKFNEGNKKYFVSRVGRLPQLSQALQDTENQIDGKSQSANTRTYQAVDHRSSLGRSRANTNVRRNRMVPFETSPFSDQISVLDRLRPFISNAELKQLANNKGLRFRKYSPDIVNRGIRVLEDLYDTGAGFSIQPDKNRDGRVNAVLDDTKNRIRLLTDRADRVGTVLTRHGSIYMNNAGPTALIGFAVGNVPGQIVNQSSGPSNILFPDPLNPGQSVQAHYANMGGYYKNRQGVRKRKTTTRALDKAMTRNNRNALVRHVRTIAGPSNSPEGSKNFIKLMIGHATLKYAEEVLGADASGVDRAISHDQKQWLAPYMDNNSLTQDDRAKVAQAMNVLVSGSQFKHLGLNKKQRALVSYAQQMAEQQEGVHVADPEVVKDTYKILGHQGTKDQDQQFDNYMKSHNINDGDRLTSQENLGNSSSYNISLTDGQRGLLDHIMTRAIQRVGTYDNGFDPNAVVNMERSLGNNIQNEMYLALNDTGYDPSHLKTFNMTHGKNPDKSDPSLVTTQDHMLQFNPGKNNSNIAYTNDDAHHPQVLDYISKQLKKMGIHGNFTNPTDTRTPVHVAMDKNGVVQWQGYRQVTSYQDHRNVSHWEPVQASIGQVFLPDKNHILHTNFNSHDNFNLIPSYKGWFQFKGMRLQRDAHGHMHNVGKSALQRLRLSGFTQMFHERLNEDLSSQIMRMGDPLQRSVNQQLFKQGKSQGRAVNDLTSPRDSSILNGLYHSELIGERVPDHWFQIMRSRHMSNDDIRAVLSTKLSKISFGKRLDEINTDDIRNPNSDFALITDGKSMSKLTLDTRNLLDPDLTSGGKQQGLTRYLVEGAHLLPQSDGTFAIAPLNHQQIQHYATLTHQNPAFFVGHTAIGYRPELKYLANMPWDRKSVAMKYATNERLRNMLHVRTGYITFGGDNMEDSTIINKATADKYKVPDRDLHNNLQYVDENGNVTSSNTGKLKMRPLKTGDKIDDFGHNKATIGLVIDPHMPMSEANARHIGKEVAIFKQNPDLQIVMSPHSPITRGNGAIADQAMENDSKNVEPVTYTYTDNDGHKHTEKLGTSAPIDFQIVKATSDKQTVTYDAENVRHGKVRKFSSQMGWGINAQHWIDPVGIDHKNAGKHIMYQIFGHNWRNLADLREYYLTTGIDIDRGGAFTNMDPKNISAYHPQEHRQMFMDQHTAQLKGIDPKTSSKFIIPKNSDDFLKALGSRGGTLVLPFNIRFEAIDPKKNAIYEQKQNAYKQKQRNYFKQYGSYSKIPSDVKSELYNEKIRLNKQKQATHVTGNQLPILSAHLRNNMTLLSNGRTQINDYNSYYAYNNAGRGKNGIFTDALSYSRNKLMFNKLFGKFKNEPGVQQALNYKHIEDTASKRSRDYYQAKDALAKLPRNDHGKRIVNYLNKMSNAQQDAQANVNQIAQKTILRQLGGWENGNSMYNKHSFLREKIMASPMGHSSTAVSQNDMRLPLDTIAVSPHIYETLFSKNALKAAKANSKNVTGKDPDGIPKGMTYDPKLKNTRVLLTRDPVIYTGSERGFKVVVDSNPYMGQGFKMPAADDNSFKGDNDGDTYSIINISENKDVQNDLKHMSVPYQLVDHSGTKNASFLDVGSDFIAGAQKAGIAQPQYITQGPNRNVEALKREGLLGKNGSPKDLKEAIIKNPYNSISQSDAKKGIFGESVKQQVENKLLDMANEVVVKTSKGSKTLRPKLNQKEYKATIAHDKPIVKKVLDYKKSPRHDYAQIQAYKAKNAKKLHIDMDATMQARENDSNHFKNACIRNDFGASNLDFTNDKALFNSMDNTVLVQGAKGNPGAEQNFNDYRMGIANNVDAWATKQTLHDLQEKSKDAPKHLAALATKPQMKARLKHLNKYFTAVKNNPKQMKQLEGQSQLTVKPLSINADANTIEAHDQKNNTKLNAKLLLKAFKMADESNSKDYVSAFNVQSMSYQDICMQNALSAKSFNTASAGTKPQQLVAAFGDKYPNLALETTYEETQANLQGKHHPELIPKIKEMLDVRVPNLLNGLHADTPSPNSVNPSQRKKYNAAVKIAKSQKTNPRQYLYSQYGGVSVQDFTKEYYNTFKDAGTDVNPKAVKKLGKVLSEGGPVINSVKDVKSKNGGSLLTGAYDGNQTDPGGFKYGQHSAKRNTDPKVRQKHDEHSLVGKGYAQQWFPHNMVSINQKRGNKSLSRNTPDKMIDPSNMDRHGRALLDAERKLKSADLSKFNDRTQVKFNDRTRDQALINKAIEKKGKGFVKKLDKNLTRQKEANKVMANTQTNDEAKQSGSEATTLNDGDINYSDTTPTSNSETQASATKEYGSSKSVAPSASVSDTSLSSSKPSIKSTSTDSKTKNTKSNSRTVSHQEKSQSSWRDYKQSSIRADKYVRRESDKAIGSVSDTPHNAPSSEASTSSNNSSNDSTLTSSQIIARRRSYNATHQSESGAEF